MSLIDGLMLITAGVFAGFLNTVAGGGSLITLPLLIFVGLPGAEANASNRVAILLQNISAVQGFRSKGVQVFPYAFWVAISASIGAIIGAYIAVDIDSELFNKILAIIMVMVILFTVFKSYLIKVVDKEIFNPNRNGLNIVVFFFIGIYGGFIQAGVGFLMIAALTTIHGLGMAKTNSIKVFVALSYTVIALGIFAYKGKILWEYGLILAIGNATGGWIASRWSAGVSDKLIRYILIVTVFALAIKLWFFS